MSQANWLEFTLPSLFTISTVVILLSSVTMFLAVRSFKAKNLSNYRLLITITAVLGVLFMILQVKGFLQAESFGVKLTGKGSNAAGSFLLAIAGLHLLHVLGGVIALLFQFFRAFSSKSKNYSIAPVEVTALYWHFVDVLWIILFVFFHTAKP
jgi:cytochrome c oxidase subunit 3